jgi:4-diphosphocytidyl-2-C-methyl-D-erythritol kinase
MSSQRSLAASGADAVVIRAPAKLNLSLAVLARRSDGYHEIESLMVPVTLHDTVRVRARADAAITLAVHYGGRLAEPDGRGLARDVPVDDSNLVVRAAQALRDAAGVGHGLDIELVKEIPSGAGLGGGSSDAAAVLLAAARVWRLDWPRERLATLAAGIGSDVPWFFAAGPAVARGRGEAIEPVAGIPPLPAVIACPAAGLSTAAVYAACTPDAAQRGAAGRLAAALATGGLSAAAPFMHNALEAPARRLCPDVDRLLAAFARAGASAPRLTGSGSACFALAESAAEARAIAGRLAAERSGGQLAWPGVFTVRLALPGAPAAAEPQIVGEGCAEVRGDGV